MTQVDKVSWFNKQLKKQIAFADLEASGTTLATFLDTAEVLASLLGMHDLLRPGERLNVKSFSRRGRLVHALAAAGWLGPLRLLIPHESEFLSNLEMRFGSDSRGSSPRQMAQQFLQQLNISIPLKATTLSRKSLEERKDYIKKHVGSAEKLFKAIHLIVGSWQIRFVDWKQSGRLQLSDDDFDIAEAMATRRFEILSESLDGRRPSYRMNNLTDALALVELSQRVTAWKEKRASEFPILFTGTKTLRLALNDLPQDTREAYFTAESPSGETLSALQDADYFVYRAIFDAPGEYLSDHRAAHLSVRGGGLEKIQEEIEDLLGARKSLQEREELEALWGFEKTHRIINELETLSFFENVWLARAEQDISKAEGELRGSARRLRNAPFREGVARLLRDNLDELSARANVYEATVKASEALRQGLLALRIQLANGRTEELDPFLRFGLLRFSLPQDSHQLIRSIVADLLSGSTSLERNARAAVLRTFQEVFQGKAVSETNLAVLAGVFWCLRRDQQLVKALTAARSRRKNGRFRHFSLEVILAATELRGASSFGKAWEIVVSLDSRVRKMGKGERRSDLMIGLAYLYFHYVLRAKISDDKLGANKELQYRERGMALAKKAVGEAVDRAKRMYAINQYLYYAVEAAVESHALEPIGDMEAMASELERALDQPGWQYRFDDTLARYYWLQASLAETESDWRRLLGIALRYFEKAKASASNDPVVMTALGQISIESSKSFRFRRRIQHIKGKGEAG